MRFFWSADGGGARIACFAQLANLVGTQTQLLLHGRVKHQIRIDRLNIRGGGGLRVARRLPVLRGGEARIDLIGPNRQCQATGQDTRHGFAIRILHGFDHSIGERRDLGR